MRQARLPLRPFELGTGELAGNLGVSDQTIRRWADALGIDYHEGPGRPVMWSDSEQRDLRLLRDLLVAGYRLAPAAEMVTTIPSEWNRGWAVVFPAMQRVFKADIPEDIPGLAALFAGQLVLVLPMGEAWVLDVPTGGLL